MTIFIPIAAVLGICAAFLYATRDPQPMFGRDIRSNQYKTAGSISLIISAAVAIWAGVR